MANGSISQQGRFTADGNAKVIKLRSDVDWMFVKNYTTTVAGGAGTGVEFMWQKGLADDYAFEYQKLAADESMVPVVATTGGFTYINTTTDSALGALNSTITAISNATPPVVTLASTAGISTGDTVRFINVAGALQFGGVDFEVGTVVANTSFPLTYAPTIVAGTTGSLRRVNLPEPFSPRKRFITSITVASPAVIATTVSHGYVAGQKLRIRVSDDFGMTQINGLMATVVSVTANTITTDIDSSAFTAFAWPLSAGVPFTPAEVVPVGEDSAYSYINLLDDAITNNGYIAMSLAAGTDSPAGAVNDVIYWRAGKSFSVDNE